MSTIKKLMCEENEGKVIYKGETHLMGGTLSNIINFFPGTVVDNNINLNENNVYEIEIT